MLGSENCRRHALGRLGLLCLALALSAPSPVAAQPKPSRGEAPAEDDSSGSSIEALERLDREAQERLERVREKANATVEQLEGRIEREQAQFDEKMGRLRDELDQARNLVRALETRMGRQQPAADRNGPTTRGTAGQNQAPPPLSFQPSMVYLAPAASNYPSAPNGLRPEASGVVPAQYLIPSVAHPAIGYNPLMTVGSAPALTPGAAPQAIYLQVIPNTSQTAAAILPLLAPPQQASGSQPLTIQLRILSSSEDKAQGLPPAPGFSGVPQARPAPAPLEPEPTPAPPPLSVPRP